MINPNNARDFYKKVGSSIQETNQTIEKLKEENKIAQMHFRNAQASANRAWSFFGWSLVIFGVLSLIIINRCSNKLDDAYQRGRSFGYNVGFSEGYEDGRKERSVSAPVGGSVSYETPTRSASNEKTTIVYVTRTGEKYHKAGCSYLKSKIEMSLEDAQKEGYEPCSRCY